MQTDWSVLDQNSDAGVVRMRRLLADFSGNHRKTAQSTASVWLGQYTRKSTLTPAMGQES
jgi:hypothetical protein